MKQPLIQQLEQLSTERWARRGVRTLVRAAWLSVCVWCVGLGGHLLWGWPLRTNLLGALALTIIGLAVASLLIPRLSARAAARRLDQRFYLDEQLATAVEVAQKNPRPGSVAARLLAESSHTADLLRRRISRRAALPWQELLTLAALILVALGLWIMSGIGVPSIAGAAIPLPGLVAPDDPAQQFPQEPPGEGDTGLPSPGGVGELPGPGAPVEGADGQPSAADPQVLEALADALRDQGATRSAADALDQGDVPGAARELRELADQASQLSDEARQDLAGRLNAAANQVEGSNQELAEQLRESARGLTQGDQAAAQALEDLARAIEQLQNGQQAQEDPQGQQGPGAQPGQEGQGQGQGQEGEPGQEQGQGQGQAGGAGSGPGGEQRQADPSDRLGVEGQAVPLESSGEGEVPVPQSGQEPGQGTSRPGFTQGDSGGGGTVQIGADPLRVPFDERDVVQEYFQP
jgi:hypothetical protein